MKRIILVYDNLDDYSKGYIKFKSQGFDLSDIPGMQYAICIDCCNVAWIDIISTNIW